MIFDKNLRYDNRIIDKEFACGLSLDARIEV